LGGALPVRNTGNGRDSTIEQYQAWWKLLPLVGVIHQQGNTKHRAEDLMKGI
jgi:hypothetical protein